MDVVCNNYAIAIGDGFIDEAGFGFPDPTLESTTVKEREQLERATVVELD